MATVTNIGARVRQLRERLGFKPADLARAALGPAASKKALAQYADLLSKLERGEKGHANPTLERLTLLAKGLRLTLLELIAQIEGLPVAVGLPQDLRTPSEAVPNESPAPPPSDEAHTVLAFAKLVEQIRADRAELIAQFRAERADLLAQLQAERARADAATRTRPTTPATRVTAAERRRVDQERRRDTPPHQQARRPKHR